MRNLAYRDIGTEKQAVYEAIRPLRYFALSMLSILLSMLFPVVKWQFLTISIITGIKWIADSNSRSIRIILEERRW